MSESTLTSAQQAILDSIPTRLELARLDRVWVFPPHHGKTRETGLFVISLLDRADPVSGPRTLLTLRYQAEMVNGRVTRTEQLNEEGRAPVPEIERVIAGVLARSGDESGDPEVLHVDGDPSRWQERAGAPAADA